MGLRLNASLAQALFETGLFGLQEEYRLPQRTLLESLLSQYWLKPQTADAKQDFAYAEQDLERIVGQLDVALLAYGHLVRSRITGSETDAVFWIRAQKTLQVTMEVCLYERASHAKICRKGEGSEKQEEKDPSLLPIFEIHMDDQGLINNVASRATAKAIKQAVGKLLTPLQVQS
jgi:hypothetical protein